VGFEEVEAIKEELDTGEEPAVGMVCVSVCGVTHIRTHTRGVWISDSEFLAGD
jgi:hypothetical protein